MNCINHLDIFGEYNELVKFFKENKTKDTVLSFNKFIPTSDNQKEKWGTGLEAVINNFEKDILEEEMEQLYYEFYTLGNPPNIWLQEIAKKYQTLEFNLVYQNTEKDVKGEIIYREGKLYHSSRIDSLDETWDLIGDDAVLELTEKMGKFVKNPNFLINLKNKNSDEYQFIKDFLNEFDENGSLILDKVINKIHNNFSEVLSS